MSKKNFEKIKDKMANARNAVAGIVNSKTTDVKMVKMIDFITYNVVHPNFLQNEQYDKLEQWGFSVVHHEEVNKISVKMLMEYFQKRRDVNNYEIDGIVVMDNSEIYNVVEGNPSYGFAFKSIMKDQYATTTVVDVEWTVSKHGYIKPRVKVEPIKLVGVTITYATAHNAKFIYENKIGPGAKIKIIRSGDVIPKIMEVVSPATNGKPKMPNISYKWTETEVDIIATDETDDDKNTIIIKQLVSTMKTLGVKYVDEGVMTKIVNEGYTSFIKILRAKHDDITEIIGSKMTEKIYTNIETALKNTELHILMASSNYFGRGVGTRKIKIITQAYPNIMNENWKKDILFENINALDGFQEKTTEKFVSGFEKFKQWFDKICKIIDIEYLRKPKNNKKSGNIFEGAKVVLTGFRSDEINKFIEGNGGSVATSVSKNTTLVVHADDAEDSSKLIKAKELGIKVISKEQFMKKYMK